MLILNEIFHPTDCSEDAVHAFYHALVIAERTKATLSIMHVTDHEGDFDWEKLPRIRPTLERWKMRTSDDTSPPNSNSLIHVKKIVTEANDPVDGILGYLRHSQSDMVVLATHQYHGVGALLHKSVSNPVIRIAHRLMLILPVKSTGFVDPNNGSIGIKNVLLPLTTKPEPQIALDFISSLLERLQPNEPVALHLLHFGKAFPEYIAPLEPYIVHETLMDGPIEKGILAVADSVHADLIALTTEGPTNLKDRFFGSTTEYVAAHARCPVLIIPDQEIF